MHLALHLQIAERVPVVRALGRQLIEIMRRGELHRLHRQLGGRAADHDRQMIRRARRGAEREHFFLQERDHAVVREDRRRRLEQKRLVGRSAALGDEQDFVFAFVVPLALGVDLDLRRHVVLGVLLLEHGEGRELRIAQVLLEIRIARALRQRGLVAAVGPDQPALLAHDDGGAGVLAHRQHAARRDVGVLEKFIGDEPVVIARLRVVEDGAQLLEMTRAQKMIDVDERGLRERAQRLRRNHEHVLAENLLDLHGLCARDLAIRRLVLAQREQGRVVVGRRGDGYGGVHGGNLFE